MKRGIAKFLSIVIGAFLIIFVFGLIVYAGTVGDMSLDLRRKTTLLPPARTADRATLPKPSSVSVPRTVQPSQLSQSAGLNYKLARPQIAPRLSVGNTMSNLRLKEPMSRIPSVARTMPLIPKTIELHQRRMESNSITYTAPSQMRPNIGMGR